MREFLLSTQFEEHSLLASNKSAVLSWKIYSYSVDVTRSVEKGVIKPFSNNITSSHNPRRVACVFPVHSVIFSLEEEKRKKKNRVLR